MGSHTLIRTQISAARRLPSFHTFWFTAFSEGRRTFSETLFEIHLHTLRSLLLFNHTLPAMCWEWACVCGEGEVAEERSVTVMWAVSESQENKKRSYHYAQPLCRSIRKNKMTLITLSSLHKHNWVFRGKFLRTLISFVQSPPYSLLSPPLWRMALRGSKGNYNHCRNGHCHIAASPHGEQ